MILFLNLGYTLSQMTKRLDEIRKANIGKAAKLRDLGINPYPSRIVLQGKVKNIFSARELLGKIVLVAGKVWSVRVHGGAVFMDLKDESGKIQLLFQKKTLGEKFELLEYFD